MTSPSPSGERHSPADSDHPHSDHDQRTHDKESARRNETEAERLDRNYGELLQELRVTQAGVQIMFAFLLTIAFQAGFDKLTPFQRYWYIGTLMTAAAAIVLNIGPVAAHRVMFRKRLKDEVVRFASRSASAGLVFLAIALVGAVGLVVDVVLGRTPMIVVVVIIAAVLVVLWAVIPLSHKARPDSADELPN